MLIFAIIETNRGKRTVAALHWLVFKHFIQDFFLRRVHCTLELFLEKSTFDDCDKWQCSTATFPGTTFPNSQNSKLLLLLLLEAEALGCGSDWLRSPTAAPIGKAIDCSLIRGLPQKQADGGLTKLISESPQKILHILPLRGGALVYLTVPWVVNFTELTTPKHHCFSPSKTKFSLKKL